MRDIRSCRKYWLVHAFHIEDCEIQALCLGTTFYATASISTSGSDMACP